MFKSGLALCAAGFLLLLPLSFGQSQTPVTLDSSETIFSVLAGMNECGYDTDLPTSDVLRSQVRQEVATAVQNSEEGQASQQALCQFYSEHESSDASSTLSEYVSLGLYLGPPPTFTPKVKDSDLPPDARGLVGILPLLQKFYVAAGLHAIWEKHREDYAELAARYHGPISKLMFDTEIYLKMPSFGYLGREFSVYLQPMAAPGQTNARNYGSNYFVVVSPDRSWRIRSEQIRHTYLHYLMDPQALKYPAQIQRLTPLLDAVQSAPMDVSFKSDAGLLVTECFIRAVEIRMSFPDQVPESQRENAVERATKQGFVLTQYFYDALGAFEKGPVGIQNGYGDILAGIDVKKEVKAADQVQFASKADPELLHLARPAEGELLNTAEQRLSSGDSAGAQKLAQQVLDEKNGDRGRALFILAQVAIMSRDMEGAQKYFQQALDTSHDPKVVAWSHIYLGRIFDLQEERPEALGHYRAALVAAAALPEAKAAAERGIEKPYAPPVLSQ